VSKLAHFWLLCIVLTGCRSDDPAPTGNNSNNSNNATSGTERNVTTSDCEITCFNRVAACNESPLQAELWCSNTVCFRLISQTELTCIEGVECLALSMAVEANTAICEIVQTNPE
jgi:hypothetical protein